MSEPLLQAVIKLFAIVAKEDDVTEDEKKKIEEFLLENLSRTKAEKYLKVFDEVVEEILSDFNKVSDETVEVERICSQINEELTYTQKIILIQQLVELILADGYISEGEANLVSLIGNAFNISEKEISLIQHFIEGETTEDLKSDQVLIVDDDHHPTHDNHIHRHGLKGFIAILYLPKPDFYFIKHIGGDDLTLNAVPFRSKKIRVFSTGSAVRSHKIEPVYFSDVASKFHKATFENRISFIADDISFKFPNGKLGLRNISIHEESGNLIGLMGASGAGKSTLLNVLNGNEPPSSGSVKINGIDIHHQRDAIEGVIGYVPQDDLLIEDITVYKNLYFAAKLCFDNLSETEIDELVNQTLGSLGLRDTAHLKVGSALEKTISGGQRKRLNIGLELLREPGVLFVDEPTSGLSSSDSENIMDLLKELSLKGKLIFIVIHQPSSDIFKMFDKMVILDVGGYQIYYGNPVDAVTYFKEIFKLVNSEEGECIECGNVNPEQIFSIIETKVIDEYGNLTEERKISSEQWNEFYNSHSKPQKVKEVTSKPSGSLHVPNRFSQLKIFSTRDMLSKISNRQYMIINILEAPLLAFILAYIVRYANIDENIQQGYLFSKNVNIPAYIFMSIIVALFMGLTVSAEEIIRDRKILKRETFLNLSRASYLGSKIGILFTISAVQTLLFVLVGNTILEIKSLYLEYWLILFTASCFANLLGLNISASFNSAVTIYILIPVLLIPQLILSGVVVSFDKLNPSIGSEERVPLVGELMASRWAFEAAMVTQFKSNPFEKQFYELDKIMGDAEFKKVYYIPKLISVLDYCHIHKANEGELVKKQLLEDFEILRREIGNELSIVGTDKFTHLDKLNQQDFTEEAYQKTKDFLEILKKYYANKFNRASEKRDQIFSEIMSDKEAIQNFNNMRDNYQNERVSQLVKNISEPHRIVESNGKLIRKIYPIYYTPQNQRSPLNFRTQFFVPYKPMFNQYFSTLGFNISVIWTMTFILIFTLYFDALRKLIETFGRHS